MNSFEVEMQHDEESLHALSHMQYDLFCTRNRIARGLLSLLLIVLGIMYYAKWWGILSLAYGCYLITSTYASSNRTARKLVQQIKDSGLPFPHSRYEFGSEAVRVISLPDEEELDPLPYAKVAGLGEDRQSLYIFRDQYGGYVVPKNALGDQLDSFRSFIEGKTGQYFRSRRQSPLQSFLRWIKKRENEPYHL